MSLEKDIEAMVNSADASLYDIGTFNENGETIYRVSIIGKDGKTDIDKCVEITHLLSPLLDVNPPMQGEYRLEVSSPGIERKLKKPRHFELSIGENIELKLYSTERVKGKLIDFDGKNVTIQSDYGEEKFALEDISSAKTYFEW